jgi:hypothetical protein
MSLKRTMIFRPFFDPPKTMRLTMRVDYGVHRDLTVKLDVKCRETDENVAGTTLGSRLI